MLLFLFNFSYSKKIIFLKKRYSFISLKHYSEILNGVRGDCPSHPIILTIDDGYWDNYTYAYPILKKYSVPATIFLTTDFISKNVWLWSNKLEFILKKSQCKLFSFPLGQQMFEFDVSDFGGWHRAQLAIFKYCRTIDDEKRGNLLYDLSRHLGVHVPAQTQGDFRPLSWSEIMEMGKHRIDFGSHTLSHRILSRLSYQDLQQEITLSKQILESHINRKVDLFCYPGGGYDDFDERAIECLKNAGYSCALTTVAGLNSNLSEKYMLRRIAITSDFEPYIYRVLTSAHP